MHVAHIGDYKPDTSNGVNKTVAAMARHTPYHVLGPRWSGSTDLIRILALANVAAIGTVAIRPMVEGRGYPRYASALIGANQALVILNAYVIAPWAGIVGIA